MSKKKKVFIVLGVALLALVIYGVVKDDVESPHWFMDDLKEELDLSAEQEERIEKIVEEKQAMIAAIGKGKRDTLSELIGQDSILKSQALDFMDFEEPIEEIQEVFAEMLVEVHAVLLPEQRTTLVEKINEEWGDWPKNNGDRNDNRLQ